MDPDCDLVPRLCRGERDALRETYERHGTRIHRLCLRLLGRVPDAEDATQEVFLRLFERARLFDGRALFSTWLHRLTVNLCLQRLEKERLRSARSLPEGDAAPADPALDPLEELSRTELRSRLELLLARLVPEQRAVLVLREIEQLSYREIAATLDIPEGTVMSRLARAREHLVHLVRPDATRTVAPASTQP